MPYTSWTSIIRMLEKKMGNLFKNPINKARRYKERGNQVG